MSTPVIVVAANASVAMSFAKRSDTPVDLGPPKDPTRYPPGHRRWGFGMTPQPTASHAIMERIRKLLVLAERGTEHEATAAAAAAQKLMATHRLTEAILAVGTDAKDEEVTNTTMERFPKRSVSWKSILAVKICRANACKSYESLTDRGLEIRIVGPETVSNTVSQLYCWLVAEIDILASKEAMGRGKAYANAWRLGCAVRIGNRVVEAAQQARDSAEEEAKAAAALEAGAPGTGLARVNAALAKLESDMTRVQEVVKGLSLQYKPTPKTSSRSGYEAGHAAGNRVNLQGSASLGSG